MKRNHSGIVGRALQVASLFTGEQGLLQAHRGLLFPAGGFRNPGSPHYFGAQLQLAASLWAHNKLCRPTSGLPAGGQAALGPHWAISQGV